jgi:LssY C-terminus
MCEIRRSDQRAVTFNVLQILVIFTMMTLFAGCATLQAPSSFAPQSINEVRFRDRAQSTFDDEVRVTTAVPSREESEALFGADLSKREIQPIWVKIENNSDHTFYLLAVAVDPNYFSPMEAAYAVRGGHSGFAQRELENHFRSMTFRNPILPNTAVSGFIFTNLDEGEKVVQVDLIASEKIKFFTFFVEIPGMRADYRMVDFGSLYSSENVIELVDEDQLRVALENLPCCTTDKEGSALGDPINFVIIGDFVDVAAAFTRRGWFPTEETYSTAVWKTIKSFLFGKRYRYAPVSNLYFYGRHPRILPVRNHAMTSTNATTCAYGTVRCGLKAGRSLLVRSAATLGSGLPQKHGHRSPIRLIQI